MIDSEEQKFHEGMVRHAGRVDAFIENQKDTNKTVSEMATNHLPHIYERLGSLDGRIMLLLWLLGIGIPAIIAATIFS